MNVEITFRPLPTWPGKPTQFRTASKFKSSYNQTIELLKRELWKLGAKAIVLQVAIDEAQIRRDGQLYADARPRHPGVVLAFDSKHGSLSYPCDRYDDWRDNLRAIALALEALRAVDRYGVTSSAQQYKGWAALPSANGSMGRQEAVKVIETYSGAVNVGSHSREVVEKLIRVAEMCTHPDSQGGNAEAFKKVQEARRVLLGA